MILSKQIIIAVLLTLLTTTTTFARKSELAELPPLQEGKARIFYGVSILNVDIMSQPPKEKRSYSSLPIYTDMWAIAIYTFYLMKKEDDKFKPLVKIFSYPISSMNRSFHYMDVDPQNFSLLVYARDRQNFGVLRGLPTTINFEVKPNQNYQLIVGIGSPEFKATPPLEALVHQLNKDQMSFCKTLREFEYNSKKFRKRFSAQPEDLGLQTDIENYSCRVVAGAKPHAMKEKDLKKMAKHYSKKEEKLKLRLEERKQHEINVANGDPSGKKTKRKAIEDAKKRKKQEKAEKWKKIREEKAKQKQK